MLFLECILEIIKSFLYPARRGGYTKVAFVYFGVNGNHKDRQYQQ